MNVPVPNKSYYALNIILKDFPGGWWHPHPDIINMSSIILNPANEQLRNEIPEPPDVKDVLHDILQKTNNIHVAFLFAGIGKRLLQKLALCLCSTRNSLVYSGWKELGIQLGLDPLLPKCLENVNIMNQDPVFTLLVPYTQIEGATVGKVYQALFDIERPDVITQTQIYVDEFYKEISKIYDMSNQIKILKPIRIPTPPIIFQNLEKPDENVSYKREKIEEINCRAEPVQRNNKNACSKIVMLTYRSQEALIAQKIAHEFRKERNGQRIGVILLQEQANKIYTDRERLIMKFFMRADFIIPILSTDYLKNVSEEEGYNSAIDNMDSAYAQYIYDLMTSEYVNAGCRNKKIRCIIPNEKFSNVRKHYFFQNTVFRTWFLLSDINELANRILSNQI